jgi:signal transduction histidine kinase
MMSPESEKASQVDSPSDSSGNGGSNSSLDLTERYRRERALTRMIDELERVADVPKLLRQALASAAELYDAGAGVIAFAEHRDAPLVRAATTGEPEFDDALLASFIAQCRPSVPITHILAPLTRAGRTVGVLALERQAPFARGDGRFLARITARISCELERREEQRVITVLERISAKIVQEMRPADLFYQILHGIRDLLRYDHSSSLFLYDPANECLTLRAEQISYIKGKSAEIGRTVPADAALRSHIRTDCAVHVIVRSHIVWEGPEPWRGLAAHLAVRNATAPPERALLVVPIVYKSRLLGVLKVSACSADAFGEREARTASRLVPFAAAALAHAQATLRFEEQLLETEKRAAMSDLARGVAHDVNNALGSILPLADQMREEAEQGELDVARVGGDLDEIARAARLAKRIMSGMLHYARGGSPQRTRVDLARTTSAAVALLGTRLSARQVVLRKEIDPAASEVYANQAQVERILLNLLLNALDASPEGSHITVRTERMTATDDTVRIVLAVEDEGPGIPPEMLAQVEEPFFTTKPGGTGLGLSICRSLAWENGGRLSIHSTPGRGTVVRVSFPAAAPGTVRLEPLLPHESTRGA